MPCDRIDSCGELAIDARTRHASRPHCTNGASNTGCPCVRTLASTEASPADYDLVGRGIADKQRRDQERP